MKMTRLAALGLVLAAAAMIASSPVAAKQGPPQGQLPPQALAAIEALIADKQSRSGVENKIDSHLLAESRMRRGLAIAAGVRNMPSGVTLDGTGRVEVEVRARVDTDLLQQISARGIPIIASEPRYDSVLIRATLDDVTALAILPAVKFIAPKTQAITSRRSLSEGRTLSSRQFKDQARRRLLDRLTPALERSAQQFTSAGPNTSQGDNTHAAAAARATYGVTGAGIKVGVLSDGVGGLASSQSRGDLDAVTVLSGQAGTGSEGTAMLEIIHDLAPGAQLYFATAFSGEASFAANIRALRNAGCDIIVDDVFYLTETPFQDGQVGTTNRNGGIIAQAVKDVVAAGALYFSSAGNEGNLTSGTSGTWEGDFVSAGATSLGRGGVMHDFGGGQYYDTITSAAPYGLTLHWSDPLGASSNDYDLFVLDSAGNLVCSSVQVQNGFQDPWEYLPSNCSQTGYRIVIVRVSGSARFLHLTAFRGLLAIRTAGEIHGHSATLSTGSFGVAATPAGQPYSFTRPQGPNPNPFNSSNRTETFSSDGPRRIFYNSNGSLITPGNVSATGGVLVNKPDFTAADGVSTGVSGFTTFYGTSAAAPHAAAIAALVKSANPALTVAEMTSILMSSTIDIEAGGVDRDSGAGILMANTAVQAAFNTQTSATLMAPNRVDPITTSSVRFSWMPMGGAQQYALYVGSSAGASDIAAQYTTGQALTITGIPVNEQPLYVRLWTQIPTGWRYRDYTFQRANPAVASTMITPAPGTTITARPEVFSWRAITGATYTLKVGSTLGGSDLLNGSSQGTTTAQVNYALDGRVIYVRLSTTVQGVTRSVDYTYRTIDESFESILTSPSNLSTTLTSSTAQFAWTTSLVGGAQHVLEGGTAQGLHDIYSGPLTSSTSATITGIPLNGNPFYVRLWTKIGSTWTSVDYIFSTADPSLTAIVSRPIMVADASTRFAWNAVSGAGSYYLEVGSSAGGSQYFYGYVSGLSVVVNNLPLTGGSIYVRMWTQVGGTWRYIDQVLEQMSTSNQARLTSPARDAALTNSATTFNWTAPGGADEYTISAGNVRGGSQYSTVTTAGQSASLTGIPMDGNPVYVRLGTRVSSVYRYVDYVFDTTAPPSTAELTAPASGASIATSTVQFSWTTITGADLYWLDVGTTVGGREIFGQSTGTSTTASVSGIALDGNQLYVRVWTRKTGVWRSNDYVFRRADVSNAALLGFPSSLTTSTVVFSWSAHPGADQYYLQVGSSYGAYNYFAGYTTGQSASVTGLPLDGTAVYAQLWTRKAGVWRSVDYVIRSADATTQALLTNANSGDTISTSSFTFNWSSVSGAVSYWLDAGNSPGAREIFGQGTMTNTSATVNGIPLNGQPLYVRVWTQRNTGWTFVDYRLNR